MVSSIVHVRRLDFLDFSFYLSKQSLSTPNYTDFTIDSYVMIQISKC